VAADAPPLELGCHLGVHEVEEARVHSVGDEAGALAADPGLVAPFGPLVADLDLLVGHGGGSLRAARPAAARPQRTGPGPGADRRLPGETVIHPTVCWAAVRTDGTW